jgi:hypothetical protein
MDFWQNVNMQRVIAASLIYIIEQRICSVIDDIAGEDPVNLRKKRVDKRPPPPSWIEGCQMESGGGGKPR